MLESRVCFLASETGHRPQTIVCYPKLHWPGNHDVLETGLADRVMIVNEYDVVAGPP